MAARKRTLFVLISMSLIAAPSFAGGADGGSQQKQNPGCCKPPPKVKPCVLKPNEPGKPSNDLGRLKQPKIRVSSHPPPSQAAKDPWYFNGTGYDNGAHIEVK